MNITEQLRAKGLNCSCSHMFNILTFPFTIIAPHLERETFNHDSSWIPHQIWLTQVTKTKTAKNTAK